MAGKSQHDKNMDVDLPREEAMKRKTLIIVVGAAIVVLMIAGVGLWEYHKQPQFCGICHIMKPYLESWHESDFGAHAHAQAGITCLECHESNIGQQVQELTKYITGNYQNPLKERKLGTKEWCLRCHGSYEELAKLTGDRTRNPHDSHYGKMECRICHRMHRESVDYCAQCHEPVAIGAGWRIASQ